MPAPYYILVPNGPHRGAPTRPHPTRESAETEAARLHALFNGALLVRILETYRDVDAERVPRRPVALAPLPDEPPRTVKISIKPKRTIQLAG